MNANLPAHKTDAITDEAAPDTPINSMPDPEFDFVPEAGVVDWDGIFGRPAKLTIEIGSGNGVWIADEAARHPETNMIGIERAGEFYGKFRKRIVRERLPNVRCIRADAIDVLKSAFAQQSIARVVCIFSDPWPKRRHRKRRVFRSEFVDVLEQVLAPGGALEFKTDVGWYFNLTVGLFRSRPGWNVENARRVEEGDGADVGGGDSSAEAHTVITNFERKGREAGSSIWAARARWDGTK